MGRFVALLGANVLYPTPLRDVLMQSALKDLWSARWSGHTHRAWFGALLRNEPARDRAAFFQAAPVAAPVRIGWNAIRLERGCVGVRCGPSSMSPSPRVPPSGAPLSCPVLPG